MTARSPQRPTKNRPTPKAPQNAPQEQQGPEEESVSYDELIGDLQGQLGAMGVEMTKQQIVIKKQRKVIADLRAGLVAKNRTGADVPPDEEGAADS